MACETGDEAGWQGYVNENLIGAGFSHGAIVNLDGTVLDASPGFSPTPGEIQEIVTGYENLDNFFSPAMSGTMTVAGEKYLKSRIFGQLIYGRSVAKGAGGIVLVKNEQAIFIGVHDENLTPESATAIVQKVAEQTDINDDDN